MLGEERDVITRLNKLYADHFAAMGEGPGEPPGFIEDAQIALRSYNLVVEEALDKGEISKGDLEAAGLPETLENSDLLDED